MRFWRVAVLLTAVTWLLASSYAASGGGVRVYRYLETLQQENAEMFAEILNSTYFRMTFAEAFSAPRWENFLEQQLAAGKDEEQAWQRYNLIFLMEKQPDEQQQLDILAAHPVLRANFLGYIVAISYAVTQQPPPAAEQVEELRARVRMNSDKFIPLIMAIDRDLSYEEIVTELHKLLNYHFSLSYRQQALMRDASIPPYQHLGAYLMRDNHIVHSQLPALGVQVLMQRGHYEPELYDLIPGNLISVFANPHFKPLDIDWQARKIGDLDLAMAIDLVSEAGVLMPHGVSSTMIADPEQHKQNNVMLFLSNELGCIGTDADRFAFLAEVAEVLNDPQQPASLFQVAQLTRLGFSLEEIRALSYNTRDAIIIGDFNDREHFVQELTERLDTADLSTALAELHAMVAATGPLLLHLLRQGYHQADISPHRTDDYLHFLIDRRAPPSPAVDTDALRIE